MFSAVNVEVGLFDFKDGGEGDLLIGSSIIDLEDVIYLCVLGCVHGPGCVQSGDRIETKDKG